MPDNYAELGAFLRLPRSGDRLRSSYNATGLASPTVDGHCYFTFFDLPVPLIVQSVAIEVITTPGGAGSVMRAGLFKDNGEGTNPRNLIADLGTQDTTGLGMKTWTVNREMVAGRLWVGIAAQGAASPPPTIRVDQAPNGPIYGTVGGASVTAFFPRAITGMTGAFPDPVNPNSPLNFGPGVMLTVG